MNTIFEYKISCTYPSRSHQLLTTRAGATNLETSTFSCDSARATFDAYFHPLWDCLFIQFASILDICRTSTEDGILWQKKCYQFNLLWIVIIIDLWLLFSFDNDLTIIYDNYWNFSFVMLILSLNSGIFYLI